MWKSGMTTSSLKMAFFSPGVINAGATYSTIMFCPKIKPMAKPFSPVLSFWL